MQRVIKCKGHIFVTKKLYQVFKNLMSTYQLLVQYLLGKKYPNLKRKGNLISRDLWTKTILSTLYPIKKQSHTLKVCVHVKGLFQTDLGITKGLDRLLKVGLKQVRGKKHSKEFRKYK